MDDTERQNLERRLDDLEAAVKAYPPLGELLASIYGLPETADARHDAQQILYAILGFLKDIPHPKASDLPVRRLFELMAALHDLDGTGEVGDILKQQEVAPGRKKMPTAKAMAHDLRARAVQSKMKTGLKRGLAARAVASLTKPRLSGREVMSQYQHQNSKGRTPMVREIADTEAEASMRLADKLEHPEK